MTPSACIISGSSGSIGSSLAKKFADNGLTVFGVDRVSPNHSYCTHTFLYDLNDIVNNPHIRSEFNSEIDNYCMNLSLDLIINCAAYQPLATMQMCDVELYQQALSVNTVFPLLLYRKLSAILIQNCGVLINIGSIHASLTKKNFALYASSKAALRSLTCSLAIENGGQVLTYLIEPAAIDTPLLRAGFKNMSFELDTLKNCHPCSHIGTPEDISEVAWFLYQKKISFLHGTTIDLSGGIKHVLHDPQSF